MRPRFSLTWLPSQLVKSDDPEKKAVAEFHPHKRHFFVFRMSKHAFFEVQHIPEIVEAIDKFIGTSPNIGEIEPSLTSAFQ